MQCVISQLVSKDLFTRLYRQDMKCTTRVEYRVLSRPSVSQVPNSQLFVQIIFLNKVVQKLF